MKKNTLILLTVIFLFSILLSSKYIKFEKNSFEYAINDSTKITIKEDFKGKFPVYYSEMIIPACNTGECRLINITMFWDIYGNYLKYSVPKDAPLTKYNHKEFKKNEYLRLHKILNNPKSKYSKFTIDKLTEKQAKNKYKVDATSGSTIKLLYDAERIKGAVKTTHTLWHIANGKIKNILFKKTKNKYSNSKSKLPYDNIFTKTLNKNLIEQEESKISNNNKDVSILISNYFLRNNIKSKKSKKFLKQYNFIEN
ncbi:MAG: hypothetical protein GXO49_02055 [Chlorobi bacterium]|nr:hypothetical protein [Chlorobiota bacterium]